MKSMNPKMLNRIVRDENSPLVRSLIPNHPSNEIYHSCQNLPKLNKRQLLHNSCVKINSPHLNKQIYSPKDIRNYRYIYENTKH